METLLFFLFVAGGIFFLKNVSQHEVQRDEEKKIHPQMNTSIKVIDDRQIEEDYFMMNLRFYVRAMEPDLLRFEVVNPGKYKWLNAAYQFTIQIWTKNGNTYKKTIFSKDIQYRGEAPKSPVKVEKKPEQIALENAQKWVANHISSIKGKQKKSKKNGFNQFYYPFDSDDRIFAHTCASELADALGCEVEIVRANDQVRFLIISND